MRWELSLPSEGCVDISFGGHSLSTMKLNEHVSYVRAEILVCLDDSYSLNTCTYEAQYVFFK